MHRPTGNRTDSDASTRRVIPSVDSISGSPSTGSSVRAIEWTLRAGAALCFIGHGAFGVITKQAWVPYFAVVGIGPDAAYRWMPVIGTLDILFGILTFVQPRAALLVWMTAWALWTASLRPLAGEPFWEALERAGNYGVPFVLLLLSETGPGWRSWFAPVRMRSLSSTLIRRLHFALASTTVLLLAGHGALALLPKAGLVSHAALLGLPMDPQSIAEILGSIEIGLAAVLIVRPALSVCLLIVAWKLGTESLFLFAGSPVWEVVERAGSYAAPLALAITYSTRFRHAPGIDK